ncbi:MAG: GHKL domain-containing protein [Lachnospiraceae bacterium]|nr:GHKL domain-containing protein [Lachnospiraceae bacterium]
MFENKIRYLKEKVESTGIGIQNIKNMMKQMGGNCIIEKDKDSFRIIFLFPKADR